MKPTPSAVPSCPISPSDVYSVEELMVRVGLMDSDQCACVLESLVGGLRSADDPGLRAAMSRAYRRLYVGLEKEAA